MTRASASTRDDARDVLARIVAVPETDLAAGVSIEPAHWAMLEAAAAAAPAVPRPQGLVGRPAPASAACWHLDALAHALAAGGCSQAGRARIRYHAKWLAHLIAPDDTEGLPRVTVLIPVYNRATVVTEAIDSCLAQTYPAIEIVVVDDGSSDPLGQALRPYGARVRTLVQANRGVSAARNAGAEAATGEFIHFLDSDNLLAPDCIAAKVDGWRAIADAELCFSTFDEIDADGRPCVITRTAVPDGGPRCPTTELMRAVAPRYPFIVSSVMLPRWLYLEVGGFEEDLRAYHEDTRLWFALGVRGTKAIAYDRHLSVKRHRADGLTRRWRLRGGDGTDEVVALRCTADLLAEPRRQAFVAGMFAPLLRRGVLAGEGERLDAARTRLLGALAGCHDAFARHRLSPLPVLLECLLALHGAGAALRAAGLARAAFRARLERGLREAMRGAAALDEPDVAHWIGADVTVVPPNPLRAMFRRIDAVAAPDERRRALAALTDALRACAHARSPRRWYAYALLVPAVGFVAARSLSGRLAWLGAGPAALAQARVLLPRVAARLRARLGHLVARARPR